MMTTISTINLLYWFRQKKNVSELFTYMTVDMTSLSYVTLLLKQINTSSGTGMHLFRWFMIALLSVLFLVFLFYFHFLKIITISSLGFEDKGVFSVTILPECYINFIILSIIQSAWTLISMHFYVTIWLWYLIRGCWCGSVNRVETISRNIYRDLSVVEREWNPTKWKGLLHPGTFPQSPAVHLFFFSSKAGNR